MEQFEEQFEEQFGSRFVEQFAKVLVATAPPFFLNLIQILIKTTLARELGRNWRPGKNEFGYKLDGQKRICHITSEI